MTVTTTRVVREVLLGVRPERQPSPARSPGGDCFACATLAAFRHLFPDREVLFEAAWEAWVDPTQPNAGPRNVWFGARSAFYALARRLGVDVDVLAERVDHHVNPERDDATWWGIYPPAHLYAPRLEAYLSAGWVALTTIAYDGPGPWTPGPAGRPDEWRRNSTDHFVLLDGVRRTYTEERADDGTFEGGSYDTSVHVVCSTGRGAYWIDLQELLVRYGAHAWWLVRRGGEP